MHNHTHKPIVNTAGHKGLTSMKTRVDSKFRSETLHKSTKPDPIVPSSSRANLSDIDL